MDYNYIDKLFVELRTQMASIQASIQAEVRSTKEDLKKEIGVLVERQVRKDIADKYGRDFAPRFVVHGLSGLARLCKARKIFCPRAEGKNKDASDPQRQSLAVRKLSQALLDEEIFLDLFNVFRPGRPPIRKGEKFIENPKRLSDAAKYLTRLKNHQRDTNGVWKLLRHFFETVRDVNNKEEVFKLLEDDSGLAIAMLDIYLKEAERRREEEEGEEKHKAVVEGEEKHKEVEEKKQEEKTEEEKKQEEKKQLYLRNELEIDVRGDLSHYGWRIGEIKSSLTTNNRKRAKSQLRRAARFLLWAANVLGKNQQEVEGIAFYGSSGDPPYSRRITCRRTASASSVKK